MKYECYSTSTAVTFDLAVMICLLLPFLCLSLGFVIASEREKQFVNDRRYMIAFWRTADSKNAIKRAHPNVVFPHEDSLWQHRSKVADRISNHVHHIESVEHHRFANELTSSSMPQDVLNKAISSHHRFQREHTEAQAEHRRLQDHRDDQIRTMGRSFQPNRHSHEESENDKRRAKNDLDRIKCRVRDNIALQFCARRRGHSYPLHYKGEHRSV